MIGEVTSGTFGPSVNGAYSDGFCGSNFFKKIYKNFIRSKRKKISQQIFVDYHFIKKVM
jgi:hypothetical protein